MVGGSGGWLADNTLMTAPLDRQSVYVRTTYDFSRAMRGWLDLSYARSHSELDRNPFAGPGALETAALTIDRRNPYLPAPVAALMDANKLTSFSMGRINAELGRPQRRDQRGGPHRRRPGTVGQTPDLEGLPHAQGAPTTWGN